MKVKLSNILKLMFCTISDINLEVFSMSDLNNVINSTKFMFKSLGNIDIEVENDCLNHDKLYGPIADCAQEMVPGVWMLNKDEFTKVVFSSLTDEYKPTQDEWRFIKACMHTVEAHKDEFQKHAETKIINYTNEVGQITDDTNINDFKKWANDNAEQVKAAAESFFEKKNNCIICGKYTIRVAKPDSPSND